MQGGEIHEGRRAPLLFAALLFASGVLIHEMISSLVALGLGGLAFGGWLMARTDRVRHLFFGLAILLSAASYAHWRESSVSPTELRRLSLKEIEVDSTWSGLIESPVEQLGKNPTAICSMELKESEGTSKVVEGRIRLTLPLGEWAYGDRIQFQGRLTVPESPRNPGEWNYAEWLAGQGIYFEAHPDRVERKASGQGSRLVAWSLQLREYALRQLTLGLEDDPLSVQLLAGMLFGYRSRLPADLVADFRNTGTYHIFAVSGQNVAVLLGFGILFLQGVGLNRWRWGWLLAPFLGMYCLLSGLQASAVRALVMALFVLGAWVSLRPLSALNLWSAALLLVLGVEPASIHDLGFQLSFLVVLALMTLTPCLMRWFYSPMDPFLPKSVATIWQNGGDRAKWLISGLLAATLAAWVGSLPHSLLVFHQASWVSPFVNLAVVPLAGLIVWIGALSLGLGVGCSAFSILLNNSNWLALQLLVGAVRIGGSIPGGTLPVADPSVWGKVTEPEWILASTDSTVTALVRYRGESWLIDTGSERAYGRVTGPLQKFYGIRSWDAVMFTSLTSAHAGGVWNLMRETSVKRWLIPGSGNRSSLQREWLSAMSQSGTMPERWSRGGRHVWDHDFSVEVLSSGEIPASRAEDRGMVLRFNYQGHRLLWAGDIGFGSETLLLKGDVQAEVLVQGRHGSESNFSDAWLQAVSPREIVVPAAGFQGHRLGWDSAADLERRSTARIWRQGKVGAVIVKVTERGFDVRGFR